MEKQTKTIGLIGGMSWESSKVYYEYTNQIVKELWGDLHSCKSVMVTVDFAEIEAYTFQDNWEAIGKMMGEAAQQLERAGADIILLCTNTIHLVSDHIMKSVSIPFLHIAEATGRAIQHKNLKKVGLLGTQFTMEKDFYAGYLKDNFGIEVIIPELEDRKMLQDIIYNELVKGVFKEESKETVLCIMNQLTEQGAEGIIHGCTELPILIPESETSLITFDTSKIHVEAAVKWALDEEPVVLEERSV